MLFLPPRFYPNHVVKIGALTVLLTSLSVFFVTHTGAHARTHTHTHTHTHLSVHQWTPERSWADCHAPYPCQWLLSDWVIEWRWVNQSFLGTFQLQLPLSALWNRNWEKWDSELPTGKFRIVRLQCTWAAPPERQARVGRELPDCFQGLVPLPPGLCCLPALPMLWLCGQTPSSFA